MSKKNKKRKAKSGRPSIAPRFAVGDRVRVRGGTPDPDFPGIPLGGWSGTILDVNEKNRPPTCLIEWDRRTVAAMQPLHQRRCLRDGLEIGRMWLEENVLEADTGEPVPIEPPTVLLSLNSDDRDDRIRAIFGLAGDEPLPDVDEEALEQYHEQLAQRLAFPFSAKYRSDSGRERGRKRQITITALLDPEPDDVDDGLWCEATHGEERLIVPLAQIEDVSGDPNRSLVEDYRYWFWDWQGEGIAFGDEDVSELEALTPWKVAVLFLNLGLLGGCYGAVLGTALAALEEAAVAVKIGAIMLAIVGGGMGAQNELPVRFGKWAAAFAGMLAGAVIGAMLGVMVIAIIGALTGAILGGILGCVLGSTRWTILGTVAGAMLGVGIQCWMRNADAAWSGAWIGGVAGVLSGPIVLFVASMVLTNQERHGE